MVIKNAPERGIPILLVILGMIIILLTQTVFSENDFKQSEFFAGIGIVEIMVFVGILISLLGLYTFYKSLSKKTLYTIDRNGILVHKKNKTYYFKDLGYYDHYIITTSKEQEIHGIIVYDKNRAKQFTIRVPVDVSAYEIIEILKKHINKLE